ncbi:MAG: lipoyl(octanoyl) transferase LipB [Candidatus Thioglobus sp.]|nr:lipoyl(octanoyl) transferase LipB [Candidatus Thioglobus sp.]
MKIIDLGVENYQITWDKMRNFSAQRNAETTDEMWIVQHPSIFTEGISSKPEHLLISSNIPLLKTDRGGQITYHAPGQLIIYCLIDIKRLGIGVKKMVDIIQFSILELLQNYSIKGHLKAGAPGVYVDNAKIAALGLKVKNGKTYHGLSLNIDMDLAPFEQINSCGYADLKATQLADLTDNIDFEKVSLELCNLLKNNVANC